MSLHEFDNTFEKLQLADVNPNESISQVSSDDCFHSIHDTMYNSSPVDINSDENTHNKRVNPCRDCFHSDRISPHNSFDKFQTKQTQEHSSPLNPTHWHDKFHSFSILTNSKNIRIISHTRSNIFHIGTSINISTSIKQNCHIKHTYLFFKT